MLLLSYLAVHKFAQWCRAPADRRRRRRRNASVWRVRRPQLFPRSGNAPIEPVDCQGFTPLTHGDRSAQIAISADRPSVIASNPVCTLHHLVRT